MTRRALGLMRGKVFISPSQEEILEATPGWDDVSLQTGRIIDETPSQEHDASLDIEMSTVPSSLDRVFDVTGSSLPDVSQEVVEFVSPPLTPEEEAEADAEVLSSLAVREDSLYNEAFESDRSQSPSRGLSWDLAADARGCCKDVPTSPPPFSGAAALEEMEVPLETRRIDEATTSDVGEMGRSWQPGLPPTSLAMELELKGGGATAAAVLPQPIAEASASNDGQPEGLQTAVAAIPVTSAGAGTRADGGGSTEMPYLPLDNEGVGHLSVTAQDNFESRNGPRIERKGEACSTAASDDNPDSMKANAGSTAEVSAPPAAAPAAVPTSDGNNKPLTLKTSAHNSANNSERGDRAFSKLMDDGLSRDGRQGPDSEAERVPVPTSDPALDGRHGVETTLFISESEDKVEAAQTRPVAPRSMIIDSPKVTTGIAEEQQEQQEQELRHQSPPRPPPHVQASLNRLRRRCGKRVCTEEKSTMVDIAELRRAVDNSEVTTCMGEGGGQEQRHQSPPRPPLAIQEKGMLRSQSEKRIRTKGSTTDILKNQPGSLPDAVMSAIKVRSGERLAGPEPAMTAAELLRGALNGGFSLPAPLQSYFS